MISEDDLHDFIRLWKQEFNEDLSVEEARNHAERLLNLYAVLRDTHEATTLDEVLSIDKLHSPMTDSPKKEGITLDDLAIMIERTVAKKDLEALHRRLDTMPTKEDLRTLEKQMDKHLDRIEERLDGQELKTASLEDRVDTHDRKLQPQAPVAR